MARQRVENCCTKISKTARLKVSALKPSAASNNQISTINEHNIMHLSHCIKNHVLTFATFH